MRDERTLAEIIKEDCYEVIGYDYWYGKYTEEEYNQEVQDLKNYILEQEKEGTLTSGERRELFEILDK